MKRISVFSFVIGILLSAGPVLADDPWHAPIGPSELNQIAHEACIGPMLLGNGSDACTQSIESCKIAYRQKIAAVCSDYEDYYGDTYYTCKESALTAAAELAKTHQANIGYNCSLTTQTWPTACGNGTKDQGEACDDGNQVDTDTCSNTCTFNVSLIVPINVNVVADNPPANDTPTNPGNNTDPGDNAIQPQPEAAQPAPGLGNDSSGSVDHSASGITSPSKFSGGGCTLGLSATGSAGSAWIGLLGLILPGAIHWLRRR